jgi:hypothetical protein
MRRHEHTTRPRERRYGALLAHALLTLLTGRRHHHSRHRPHLGRQQPLASSRFGPSCHRAGRHWHRRGQWSQ